jgi:poly-beta-hydroxybutyrate-responsive repressor
MMNDTLERLSTPWLVLFLLLLMRERDSCGQDLIRRTVDLGFGATRPGTVYWTLRQMENEGIVLSERDGFDCRLPRRKYSITELGEDYLEFWASSLAEYREDMDLFLEVYAKGIGRVHFKDTYLPVRVSFSRFRKAEARGAEHLPTRASRIIPQRTVEEGR